MKETILIVEDEKDIIKMLEYDLKKEGFKTLSARNGEDALDLAVRQHPDFVEPHYEMLIYECNVCGCRFEVEEDE